MVLIRGSQWVSSHHRMRAKQAGLPLIHNDWETMHGNLWQPQLSGGGAIYFLYTRAALHCLACRLAVAIASLQSHLGTFSYLRAFECIGGANRNHPCRNSSASSWKNLVSQRSGRPAHPLGRQLPVSDLRKHSDFQHQTGCPRFGSCPHLAYC